MIYMMIYIIYTGYMIYNTIYIYYIAYDRPI